MRNIVGIGEAVTTTTCPNEQTRFWMGVVAGSLFGMFAGVLVAATWAENRR